MSGWLTRLWHTTVAALVVASALVSPALAGKADNSVRFLYDQTLESVDPYFNISRVGTIVADAVWDTLIYRDPETGAFTGNLATTWRWIDDRTLEFELRQGVRFHNGEPFDDVVYTVNFIANPENKVVAPNRVGWVDHAERIDDFRVRIVAKRPFPAALLYLAYSGFPIHPNTYYAKVGPSGMSEKPVGSGPYRVVEHALGKYILLQRNSEYFKDSPKAQPAIDRVEVRFIPDAQTRVAEMVAGGADLIMSVARDQADQLREVPGLQVLSGDTLRYAFLQMNTLPGTPAPQLRDVRVRQAIMHAIDRDALAAYLVGERSRVLHSECHPAQFGCTDAGMARYPYDPQKARALLADAGYADGFDIDIYASRDRNPAEAIIGYLAALGIRARLRFMQEAAITSALRAGRVGLAYVTFGGLPDIRSPVAFFHGFTPDDVNRDPEIRDLHARGDSTMDPDARKAVYARALALLAERAYAVPLYSIPNYYLAARGLEFRPPADELPRFNEMLWK